MVCKFCSILFCKYFREGSLHFQNHTKKVVHIAGSAESHLRETEELLQKFHSEREEGKLRIELSEEMLQDIIMFQFLLFCLIDDLLCLLLIPGIYAIELMPY